MEIIKKTIGQIFRQTVQRFPERDAVVFHGKHCTYRELKQRVDRLAKGMAALGIRRGSHVAVWANNRPAALECFLAVWSLGAVLIPISTGCNARELGICLQTVDAEYLIFDTGYKTTSFAPLAGAQTVVPRNRVFALEDDSSGYFTLAQVCAMGQDISDGELEALEARVTPDDWDCFLFTSGSSGRTHAVVTTHRSRVNNVWEQARAIDATCEDRYCVILPMYHCFSISAILLTAIISGGCLCFPEDRHIATVLATISRERCTVLSAVPTLFMAILAREDLEQYDLSSLRTGMIGGSTYPPELFSRICSDLNMTLLPSLGQTEATAGFTSGSAEDSLELRMTTVGTFFPGVAGKIVDTVTGKDCPPDTVGEICVRSYNVMQGYYHQGQLTREPVDADGWLHTGDLGCLDQAGYLRYRGRLREMINRGGERISPAEIENVILAYPGVYQAKAVSIPDRHYIEEICACVVMKAGQAPDPEGLKNHCETQLAGYKVPRYFLFPDKLPLLSSGKPDGSAIRSAAIRALGLEEI